VVAVEVQNVEEMSAPLVAYVSKLGAIALTSLRFVFCTQCLHDPS